VRIEEGTRSLLPRAALVRSAESGGFEDDYWARVKVD
jgi:hypothetical protein